MFLLDGSLVLWIHRVYLLYDRSEADMVYSGHRRGRGPIRGIITAVPGVIIPQIGIETRAFVKRENDGA